jgi:hypothetical protein
MVETDSDRALEETPIANASSAATQPRLIPLGLILRVTLPSYSGSGAPRCAQASGKFTVFAEKWDLLAKPERFGGTDAKIASRASLLLREVEADRLGDAGRAIFAFDFDGHAHH